MLAIRVCTFVGAFTLCELLAACEGWYAPITIAAKIDAGLECGAAPDAGVLAGITVEPNRDSVILHIPLVPGAQDYRAIVLPAGSSRSTDACGREAISGATLFCAGLPQHNQNTPPNPAPVQDIEIAGLEGPTDIVVEAIDRQCPFPGLFGAQNFVLPASPSVSTYTEDQIRSAYGSMIINGQGPGSILGAPGSPDAPVVLATSTITVTPTGNGVPPTQTFFEDFSSFDPPAPVPNYPGPGTSAIHSEMLANESLFLYDYGSQTPDNDLSSLGTQFFVDRGELNVVFGDFDQGVPSWVVIMPRQMAQLSSSSYLHVTYETDVNCTGWRAPWMAVCGADTPGQTVDANGIPLSQFGQPVDGFVGSLSDAGWNCFELTHIPGVQGPIGTWAGPTDIGIDVLVTSTGATTPTHVSPMQTFERGWFLQQSNGVLVAPILDDQMHIAPKTHFDLYLRRDRAVLYVNGQQRMCNDFPSVSLTMADSLVMFGQALVTSGNEHSHLVADDTGQIYYLNDSPWTDERRWDNIGFDNGVPAPSDFDQTDCYVYTR